jgi:hypothetical protein
MSEQPSRKRKFKEITSYCDDFMDEDLDMSQTRCGSKETLKKRKRTALDQTPAVPFSQNALNKMYNSFEDGVWTDRY